MTLSSQLGRSIRVLALQMEIFDPFSVVFQFSERLNFGSSHYLMGERGFELLLEDVHWWFHWLSLKKESARTIVEISTSSRTYLMLLMEALGKLVWCTAATWALNNWRATRIFCLGTECYSWTIEQANPTMRCSKLLKREENSWKPIRVWKPSWSSFFG